MNRLKVYDIRTWKLVANSLEKLFVRNIYVDSAGNAWIASIGSGVLLLRPGSIHAGHLEFERLPPPFDPFLHSEFRAIVEDKKKNIWMASVNSGLVKYNPHSGAFSHITTDQGLAVTPSFACVAIRRTISGSAQTAGYRNWCTKMSFSIRPGRGCRRTWYLICSPCRAIASSFAVIQALGI